VGGDCWCFNSGRLLALKGAHAQWVEGEEWPQRWWWWRRRQQRSWQAPYGALDVTLCLRKAMCLPSGEDCTLGWFRNCTAFSTASFCTTTSLPFAPPPCCCCCHLHPSCCLRTSLLLPLFLLLLLLLLHHHLLGEPPQGPPRASAFLQCAAPHLVLADG